MNKLINKFSLGFLVISLSGCGGGGGGGTTTDIPNTGAVILTVNKNGVDFTDALSTSSNLAQSVSSAYFVSTNAIYEWTGSNMTYTSGYVTPTGGVFKTFQLTKRQTSELAFSISNSNYDISKTAPSLSSDVMPWAAFHDAAETKIRGGNNDDITNFFVNTSEVDLAAGNDTLRLSQNYSLYQFSRVTNANTSINVTRDGHTTLIKNVESFQFADVTKTLTEILATLP
jgi:hypothetical protein